MKKIRITVSYKNESRIVDVDCKSVSDLQNLTCMLFSNGREFESLNIETISGDYEN